MRALSDTFSVAGRSGRTEINGVALEWTHVEATAELVFPHFRSYRICMAPHSFLRALLRCSSLTICPQWEWGKVKPLLPGFWKSLFLLWVSASRVSSSSEELLQLFPIIFVFKTYLLIKQETQRVWSLSLENWRESTNSSPDTQIWKMLVLFQGSWANSLAVRSLDLEPDIMVRLSVVIMYLFGFCRSCLMESELRTKQKPKGKLFLAVLVSIWSGTRVGLNLTLSSFSWYQSWYQLCYDSDHASSPSPPCQGHWEHETLSPAWGRP